MSEHIDRIKKLFEWSKERPWADMKYAIKKLEYYEQELFKYAQFKEGDEVEIGKDMNLSPETSPGYWAYRDRLQVGCCGKVIDVDHYKGQFRYSVVMEPKDDGYFTLREETLKPKGWDRRKNGEES